MLPDDNEQQPSSDFRTPEALPADDSNGAMASVTKAFRLSPLEFTVDGENENSQLSRQPLIEQLQAQLTYDQIQRSRARDYTRILGLSNTPAAWYKSPTAPRSVYYYDSNYQRQRHQPPVVSESPRVKVYRSPRKLPHNSPRLFNQGSFIQQPAVSISPLSNPHTTFVSAQLKPPVYENFHPPSPNFPQRRSPVRLRKPSIPTLPPIEPPKELPDMANVEERRTSQPLSIDSEPRKRFHAVVLPPTS